ncbi:MAG: 4a-hydroxytetrahydrobiopterin dehydratase [Bacteroidota bacterium]
MDLPENWTIENGQLTRTFIRKNFVDAVDFVNKITPMAEEADHHPDVEIFAYKKVKVKLMSHDVGEITERDIKLAEKINKELL